MSNLTANFAPRNNKTTNTMKTNINISTPYYIRLSIETNAEWQVIITNFDLYRTEDNFCLGCYTSWTDVCADCFRMGLNRTQVTVI